MANTVERPRVPDWAQTPSPFSGPWSEVLAHSTWYRLFPDAPPFDSVTPLRQVLIRKNPLTFPLVLRRDDELLGSPLAQHIDRGPESFKRLTAQVTPKDVEQTLTRLGKRNTPEPSFEESAGHLRVLLSEAASSLSFDLLALAIERHSSAPRSLDFYAPIYLSNACTNHCTYCGFHVKNKTPRRTLEDAELLEEARILQEQGHRHILLLTGESPRDVSLDRLERTVQLLSERFDSVGLEIYPLEEEAYARLERAGASSLTVYQETYDVALYREVHRAGRKRDFLHRLGTPERGARARIPKASLGVLLGLGQARFDTYALGLHALELMHRHPELQLGMSFPRMRPADSQIPVPRPVDDTEFLHLVAALRLVFPRAEFNLSTRETASFRNVYGPKLFDRLSAGCSTEPGGYARARAGHTTHKELPQFEIADHRSLLELRETLSRVKPPQHQLACGDA